MNESHPGQESQGASFGELAMKDPIYRAHAERMSNINNRLQVLSGMDDRANDARRELRAELAQEEAGFTARGAMLKSVRDRYPAFSETDFFTAVKVADITAEGEALGPDPGPEYMERYNAARAELRDVLERYSSEEEHP